MAVLTFILKVREAAGNYRPKMLRREETEKQTVITANLVPEFSR